LKDGIRQVIGRTMQSLETAGHFLFHSYPRGQGGGDRADFDKTGLMGLNGKPLKIWHRDSRVVYAAYDSFAHSYWRAQEFSLFARHLSGLTRPLMDFGCGDGSFASVLFQEVEYGVDHDPEALQAAKKYGLYCKHIQSIGGQIPLPDSVVSSVISNSVLEHVIQLDRILGEIHRVLKKDGILMFTVPVGQFYRDFAKYFGTLASIRINRQHYHHNLLEPEEWCRILTRRSFSVIALIPYQPDWFTFNYWLFRYLSPRALGRLIHDIRDRVWTRYQERLIAMVNESIEETQAGGNIFLVCQK
jgi:ubiquinone/menaquinone biosynthesis C-methylase UbiE